MAVSIAFGPVPSRRLGQSLGVNHLPAKICTYSCVYCQVGRTTTLTDTPCSFYGADAVVDAVRGRVEAVLAAGGSIDNVSFVPDGEPTLDADLGEAVGRVRRLGIPIAILTNGTLLDRPGVRDALGAADHVSLKVDTVREATWRRIDRPHGRLRLASILEGMRRFAREYRGTLDTDTMLVAGLNDSAEELRETAEFVASVAPATAYLTVPVRPPAESWVRVPSPAVLALAEELFSSRLPRVELLTGSGGDDFGTSGDATGDLLSIAAVHPMSESAVRRLLQRSGQPWSLVTALVDAGHLLQVEYEGERYFRCPVPGRERQGTVP